MDSLFLEKLHTLSLGSSLPEYSYLMELSDNVCSVLETENPAYRPLSKNKVPGGLIDFTGEEPQKLPVIVVPDLHARAFFLYNILRFTLPADFLADGKQCTVIQALEQKKLRVVCAGDLLHSELRGRDRWIEAWNEFLRGNTSGPAMTQEMMEGLSLLCMTMELKCAFPEFFHVLKGNHENILNKTGNGDFSFCKFANEGEMVKLFMEEKYGDEMLYVISCFEKSLPLAAAFPECIISHAEPLRAFSRQEIIDGLKNGETVKGLTWTENNKAKAGGVEAMLCTLTGRKDFLNARYIAGHRPVKENYALRQNGYFVQIHNPDRQNIALVHADRVFNPEKDIVCVE